MINFSRYLLTVAICFLAFQSLSAQKEKRQELEQKRQALRQEISQYNKLLSSNKQKKQSVLNKAGDLNRRIKATEQLIRTNNQDANLLTQEIDQNINRIVALRNELEELKKDYGEMMKESYKSRSKQSRIMFLFSSENFLQAYKRLQYMQQYTKYREEQGKKIKKQTKELENLNKELAEQREEKKKLLAKNRETQNKLKVDKKEQDRLIAKISQKGGQYQKQIKNRQQQISKLDAEIDRLVREAIARENKDSGSDSKTAFKLTPEAKALAASFKANKGSLPWPLKSGQVIVRFGKNPSALAKNVVIESHGIRIETNEDEAVYSIFKGKVIQIQSIKGANKAVYVQHGNYISIYNNLKGLHVRRGDQVETGDRLGRVGVSTTTHRPALYFAIYNNNKAINPMSWILKR